MADDTDDSEKTEDPTHKRLKEAHDKGDVPKSQEVSTWFTLAGATLMIAIFAPSTAVCASAIAGGAEQEEPRQGLRRPH